MAEFLTTNGTSYHIENIIIGAKSKLMLVSPYLQISKTFLERLKDASNKGVAIIIIYGKDDLKTNEHQALAELKNLELFFFKNLHAKCYFNENNMVITSMNMYEFSEKNNREMGVFIDRKIDNDLYEKAVEETNSILQSAEKIKLKKENKWSKVQWTVNVKPVELKPFKNNKGYCIRCGDKIPYNPDKPYCIECFNSWSRYQNDDYEETFCHRCGHNELSSMAKPQCYDCFNEWRMEL